MNLEKLALEDSSIEATAKPLPTYLSTAIKDLNSGVTKEIVRDKTFKSLYHEGFEAAKSSMLQILATYTGTATSFDLAYFIQQLGDFSDRTFGPGLRTNSICDHIAKELEEVKASPYDLSEWVDILDMAFDGARRAGYSPDQIAYALFQNLEKNKTRKWPDWRTQDPNQAIEHIRDGEAK